jgi:hypothetical protein
MRPSTPPVRLQRRRLPHSWSCGTRGPRGRPPSPWLGRRPRRTPGGDRGYAWRCGTAGAGGPTLSRAAVLQPLPSQALLLADDTFAATDAMTGRHCDRQPRLAGWPCRIRSQAAAITHRFIPWPAPGARLPGLVGRTCCRPGHERSSPQASAVGRRRRGWTGPRRSVEHRPAQRTAAAPTRRPRAGWSRTCRTRLAGGGWGSALPVPARAGVWGWATAGRRGRGRGG